MNAAGNRTPQPKPPGSGEAPARGSIVLSVCSDSGMLATENCPHVIAKAFRPREAPSQPCPLHRVSGAGAAGGAR